MGDNTKEQINMTKVEELEAEIKEVEDNEKEIERQIRDIDEEMENLEGNGLSQPEATGRQGVQEPGGEARLPQSEIILDHDDVQVAGGRKPKMVKAPRG